MNYIITYYYSDLPYGGNIQSDFVIVKEYDKLYHTYNSLKNNKHFFNIKVYKTEDITDNIGKELNTYLTYDDINKLLYPLYSHKITATLRLLKIAEYYNKNRELEDEVYYIVKEGNTYNVFKYVYGHYDYGVPVFYNEEDARKVIENPNFKSILENYFK